MRGAAAWLAALVWACGSAGPAAERPSTPVNRGTLFDADDVSTVRLSTPSRQAPAEAFRFSTRRRQGPGRGPGCRCNRRQCTMSSQGRAAEWCGVHQAVVKNCFDEAKLTGDAVMTLRTNATGAVEYAGVHADPRVVECLYEEATRAAFPERPNATFQIFYQYPP